MPFDDMSRRLQLALDLEKLRFARAGLADRNRWCTGIRHDGQGRHCLMGWLEVATGEASPCCSNRASSPEAYRLAETYLIPPYFPTGFGVGDIEFLNDTAPHDEVVEFFDRAIARAERRT